MRMGSLWQFQGCPTIFMRVSRQHPNTDECDKPGLALSHNRGKSTKKSHICCGNCLGEHFLLLFTTYYFLYLNRGKSTKKSHICCGVMLELSWGTRSDSRSQTFADWVGHSLIETCKNLDHIPKTPRLNEAKLNPFSEFWIGSQWGKVACSSAW